MADRGSSAPDLIISALYVTDGGVAVYPVEAIILKKDLAEDGVSVEYEHPADQRQYKRLYSGTAQIAVDLVVSLSSGGLIWALQSIARRHGEGTVRLTAKRTVKTRGSRTTETLEYKGPASAASETVLNWRAGMVDDDEYG